MEPQTKSGGGGKNLPPEDITPVAYKDPPSLPLGWRDWEDLSVWEKCNINFREFIHRLLARDL